MKCTYTKPCDVRKPDGLCNASIKGYCDFQEKPKEEKPVVKPTELSNDPENPYFRWAKGVNGGVQ